ncbi:MAG TPA: adenylyl-sulfate kinase [Sideroxyarcus sp.]|nr:adenylyl-sulfate kinase [Sideroxyarcus sp.]
MSRSSDVVWHPVAVTRGQREQLNAHRGAVLWFTGLSGSGKSTLAHAVEARLHQLGCRTFVLDGDNVRHGLCGDLGFSLDDRAENMRRVGEVGKLFVEAGVITMVALISPLKSERERVRALFAAGDYLEIFCRCPLEVCESRDVKGVYKKARRGEIQQFTGISSPYDEPANPELGVDTSRLSLEESVEAILGLLRERGIISPAGTR